MVLIYLTPAQEFALSLRNRLSAIHEVPPPRSFTFLSDACRGLEQARKVGTGDGDRGWGQGLWREWREWGREGGKAEVQQGKG